MKKIIIYLIMTCILSFIVLAQTSVLNDRELFIPSCLQNRTCDIKVECIIDGKYCSNNAECNISFYDPYRNILQNISNKQMTNNYTFHNYTTKRIDFYGNYKASVVCCDQGECNHNTFRVIVIRNTGYFNFDLGYMSNIILLFILLFFWLGCNIIALFFKNKIFASFGFFIGIFIGFMMFQLHVYLVIAFLFLNIITFLWYAKNL